MKNCVVLFLTAVLFSGCVSTQTGVQDAKNDDSVMLQRGKAMIEAFRKKDYPLFSSQFGGKVPDNFGKKEFDSGIKQMSSRVGKVVSSRFLGTLSGPVFTTWLWAVAFEKEGSDHKKVAQEMIFKVVAGKLDGKMQIVSFGFLI